VTIRRQSFGGENLNQNRHNSFSKSFNSNKTNGDIIRPVKTFTSAAAAAAAAAGDGKVEDGQQGRRRGGSLPVATPLATSPGRAFLSPHASPGSDMFGRPKSNSYCEGASPTAMNPWLQRRKAASRLSEGNVVINGVIRQPKGPDGTKGFREGYRELILQERRRLSSGSESQLTAVCA